MLRAAAWPAGELDERGERIAGVILDEIRTLPVDPLGLLRIARAILDEPSDERSLEAWAAWAAIGYSTPSTFIALFKRTFGATPAGYRERLRLSSPAKPA
ncbi:hypothetical protein [Massilia sp. BKSP1R2A-1]|uniref:hypothetical protein n=1 Tax=Massilia sp. BKSP1R2A-1 TaxID=3422595 RepID=UPI003D34F96F